MPGLDSISEYIVLREVFVFKLSKGKKGHKTAARACIGDSHMDDNDIS